MAEKTFHSITLPNQDTARVPLTAAEFSTSVAYEVKDYCTYQGKLYRCTTTHAAGEWNDEHFTATDVDTEFDRKLDIPVSQANAPENPRIGDLWIDSDENSPIYNVDVSPILGSTNVVQSGGTKVALNSLDSRKMEHGVITGDFSPSVDYRIGDLVFYATTANGITTRTLYRCIVNHDSTDWNAEHFTATTLEVELQKIRDGEANTDMIGDLFGAKSIYAIGDYCVYKDKLYRCIRAIDNSGTDTPVFNLNDWNQIKLANEVNDLKNTSKINFNTLKNDINVQNNALENCLTYNIGKNIFNQNFPFLGTIQADGSETDNINYVKTDFIPIDSNNSKLYFFRENQPYFLALRFYSNLKEIISGGKVIFTNTISLLKNDIDIPEDAAYIRMYKTATANGLLCVGYSNFDEYEDYHPYYEIKDESIKDLQKIKDDILIKKQINIFDGSFPFNGYLENDGSFIPNNNWHTSDYITINSTYPILYILRENQPYQLSCAFYKSDKSFNTVYKRLFKTTDTSLITAIEIPQNTSYIRICKSASISDEIMLSYTGHQTFYQYGTHYFQKTPLYGKKIVFMGDSIIGNFYDATGVCSILENITGATVYNCAFGGTRMAYRYGNNIQYTYDNKISGVGLSFAISSGDWSEQETALENMSQKLEYFDNRLQTIKSVDWSTIDYVIWEYGTNDFATQVKVTDSDDSTNLYAFDNAYKTAIETIMRAYNNILIIPVSPTWRWYRDGEIFIDDSNTHIIDDYSGQGRLLTDFVEVSKNVAKIYQLPYIDDYYTIGMNKINYLRYFNNDDGVHPKAEGRKLIAEHIAAQLLSLVR